jgi:hypothetical protein
MKCRAVMSSWCCEHRGSGDGRAAQKPPRDPYVIDTPSGGQKPHARDGQRGSIRSAAVWERKRENPPAVDGVIVTSNWWVHLAVLEDARVPSLMRRPPLTVVEGSVPPIHGAPTPGGSQGPSRFSVAVAAQFTLGNPGLGPAYPFRPTPRSILAAPILTGDDMSDLNRNHPARPSGQPRTCRRADTTEW